jgi:hypothetical protein
MSITGRVVCLEKSITDSTLVTVMDGSYIRELFLNLCSTTFILKCSKRRGKIVSAFLESIHVANAYRGKLLGLVAIHLIIVSVNKMNSVRYPLSNYVGIWREMHLEAHASGNACVSEVDPKSQLPYV